MKSFTKIVIGNHEIIGEGRYIYNENDVFIKTEEDEIKVFFRKALSKIRKISLLEFDDSVIAGPLIIKRIDIDFDSGMASIYLKK